MGVGIINGEVQPEGGAPQTKDAFDEFLDALKQPKQNYRPIDEPPAEDPEDYEDDTDNPEEYIEITSYGDGIDSQDKSVGKAMTYADKYALMKGYKIITGEDPDQEESKPLKSVRTRATAKAPVCECCGKPIQYKGRFTADEIAERTFKTYGKTLCYDCGVKEGEKNG